MCICMCLRVADPAFAWPIVRRRSRSGQSSETGIHCVLKYVLAAARCAMHYYMKGVDVVDIVDLCWVIICCVKPLIYHTTGYKE